MNRTTFTEHKPPTRINWPALVWIIPIAILLAAAINSFIYYLGISYGYIIPDLPAATTRQQITLTQVVVFTALAMLVGFGVFVIIAKISRRPFNIFRVVAFLGLFLDMATPLLLPESPLSMRFLIYVMQIVAAVVLVAMLERFAKLRRP